MRIPNAIEYPNIFEGRLSDKKPTKYVRRMYWAETFFLEYF